MNKISNFCARAIVLIALLVSALQVNAAPRQHPDNYYPPYIYIDGMVNGADYWNSTDPQAGNRIMVPHSGNGVYYALLIRPGGNQVKIDGTVADAHGSNGGGRFRITYPDVNAQGKQYTVDEQIAGESSVRTHINTVCFCVDRRDTELFQGTEVTGLSKTDPASRQDARASFFVHEDAIANYRNKRIFMVKIDLKNNTIKWLADDDPENKPHTWYICHTGSSISSIGDLKEYNNDNFENGNNKLGHYDFSEPLLPTETEGVFEAKHAWFPQIATKNADESLSWNKCYFNFHAIPSYKTSYSTAWNMSQNVNYRYKPSDQDERYGKDGGTGDIQIAVLGKEYKASKTLDSNVFKIEAGDGAETRNQLLRGYYNVRLDTRTEPATITFTKGIPENLWIMGTVNFMTGWDYVSAWTTAKLDKGSEGIFYGTIRRNNSYGYTFTFTDRNVETGSQKRKDLDIHRINGGQASQSIILTKEGTEAVCKGDVDLSNGSYAFNDAKNAGINFAYAKVDMNNDKVTFSTVPNLMFINIGSETRQMTKTDDGWVITLNPSNYSNTLNFNFCTMSSEPNQDLFGPAANANLAINAVTEMTAHTAGGKYTVTPLPATNIDYNIYVTLNGDKYEVYVAPTSFYVVGNKDIKESGWNYTKLATRKLTQVSRGKYVGEHSYFPAEWDATNTKWKDYSYFWFAAEPDGQTNAYRYCAMTSNGSSADKHLTNRYSEKVYVLTNNNAWRGSFIVVPGHYDVTLDIINSNVNVARTIPEDMYVFGDTNGRAWSDAVADRMYSVGNGHYYGTICDFNNGKAFTFLDKYKHRYAPELENVAISETNFGNEFDCTEQLHTPYNGDTKKTNWGSFKVNGVNYGAVYADCDIITRKVTFSRTPYAMGVVVGGNVIPMVKEADGKFYARNAQLTGNFYLTSMPGLTASGTPLGGTRANFNFAAANSNAISAGTEYAANVGSSTAYNLNNKTGKYDVMFDPTTNKMMLIDTESDPTANGGKIVLATGTRKTYCNPISEHGADPSVVRGDDGKFYIYSTHGYSHSSNNLLDFKYIGKNETFTLGEDAKDYLKDFTTNPALWAPDVNRFGKNDYYALYSASYWGGNDHSAIGIKTATSAAGPWEDHGLLFTVENSGIRNCIDAQLFIDDDGQKYVVDGSFNGIYIIPLADDGLSVKAGDHGMNSKVKIAGSTFEGSYIYKRDGWYYYIGSSGKCCDPKQPAVTQYALSVARSKNLFGPYLLENGSSILDFNYTTNITEAQLNTLKPLFLQGNDKFIAPGHNGEIITDDEGQDWIIYHAYDRSDLNGDRVLLMDRVVWENGWPRIQWKDATTGAIHTGEPSYRNVAGPVFYDFNTVTDLEKNGNTYTASAVNINSGDPELVRVFEVHPDNWSSEWNIFHKRFGAVSISSADYVIPNNVAKNMGSEANDKIAFTTASGKYNVEVNLGSTPNTIKLVQQEVAYPKDFYMIGNINNEKTDAIRPDWYKSYICPIRMIPDATTAGVYYSDIYITSNSAKQVEWSFATIKSADRDILFPKRYGPSVRSIKLEPSNFTDGTYTTDCLPDINGAENCYIMNATSSANKFEAGIYHVKVDLRDNTMTLTKKDNDANKYPNGLYVFHCTSVLNSGESTDWNWSADLNHVLVKTGDGVYEGKGIALPFEKYNADRNKQVSYFAISSVVAPYAQWREAQWAGSYGVTEFSYADALNDTKTIPNVGVTPGTAKAGVKQTSSFFNVKSGRYDIKVDLKNGTLLLTPSTEYPENLYIVGDCDFVGRDAKGEGRIKMYNAGNGKYYGLINVAAADNNMPAEAGTFMFTATQSNDPQEIDCLVFGSNATGGTNAQTTINVGETKPLEIVSRYVSQNNTLRSDFCFKTPGTGKYYAEVDLAAGTLKLSDKPSVLYIIRDNSPEEEDIVPNDWNWLMNGEQGVLLRQPDSPIDFKTTESVVMPAIEGSTNSTYSLSGIAVPTIYSSTKAWKIIKADRWGSATLDDPGKTNNGTWPQTVNILGNDNTEAYKNIGAGTYDLVFNIATGGLIALYPSKRADYENAVTLFGFHSGYDGGGELSNKSNWNLKKFDDNTYYMESIHSTPESITKAMNRFTILINGKYQICADPSSDALTSPADVANQWKIGHIGDAAVTAASKGLFSINNASAPTEHKYYGFTVKKLSDTEWKICASDANLGFSSSKVAPALGDDYIVRQPERLSWTNPGEASKFEVRLKDTSANPAGDIIEAENPSTATSLDLHGLYSGAKYGKSNNAMLRATHGATNIEQVTICGFSKTDDKTEFTNVGTLTLTANGILKSDDRDAYSNIYGTNFTWNYTTAPAVLPSYYTIWLKDEITGAYHVPTIDTALGTTITDGTRIVGSNVAGNRIGDDNSTTYRAVYMDNINFLGEGNDGKCKITFILRPKYVVFQPTELTADASIRSKSRTKSASLKAVGDPAPIINPDNLDQSQYAFTTGTDLTATVIFDKHDEPTSIDDILNNANTFIVIGGQGFVKVQGENVDVVEIYSVGGIRLASHVGACEIPLAAGTYVVRVNNTTTKVIVK